MPSTPLAIFCSDLHLSHNPPKARAGEENWYKAMAQPLWELTHLQKDYEVPIYFGGDLFHHWDAPAELINFAITELPFMQAIPGQHDLPNHSYAQIKRSAYWTLHESGAIRNMDPGEKHCIGKWFTVHAFPFGFELTAPNKIRNNQIALVHQYLHKGGDSCYIGASEEDNVKKMREACSWYHAIVSGDNHISFDVKVKGCRIFNCGGMMRRNSDQRDHMPRVGVLLADGTIDPYYFNISGEVFKKTKSKKEDKAEEKDIEELLEAMEGLSVSEIQFLPMLSRYMKRHNIDKRTQEILTKAIDQASDR